MTLIEKIAKKKKPRKAALKKKGPKIKSGRKYGKGYVY